MLVVREKKGIFEMRTLKSDKQFILISILSFFLTISCSEDYSGLKILGGKLDNSGFKSTVLLNLKNGATCTGTFIKPKIVLTAAHCVEAAGNGSIRITDRSPRSGSLKLDVKTDDFKQPSSVDDSNDVALLYLKENPKWPVSKIAKSSPKAGDPVTLVGYGRTDWGVDDSAQETRKSGKNVIEKVDEDIIVVSADQISSTTAITDAGDSGGPLLNKKGEIIGVVSRGTENPLNNGNKAFSKYEKKTFFINVTSGKGRDFLIDKDVL